MATVHRSFRETHGVAQMKAKKKKKQAPWAQGQESASLFLDRAICERMQKAPRVRPPSPDASKERRPRPPSIHHLQSTQRD